MELTEHFKQLEPDREVRNSEQGGDDADFPEEMKNPNIALKKQNDEFGELKVVHPFLC